MKADKQTTKGDMLRKVPLFSDLSKKNLNEIAKITDELDIPAGKVLVKQGELGFEFVLILEGMVKVERDGKVINRLYANDFFGEIALIDKRTRIATVTAETNAKLLVVELGYFAQLLEKAPRLCHEIMLALCKYVRFAEDRHD